MFIPTIFSVLLTTAILGLFTEAVVVPTKPNKPGSVITLPLRSLHDNISKNIHPRKLLQMHINRADRRIARMAGRDLPTDGDLRARPHKRISIIGGSPAAPDHKDYRRLDNPGDLMASNSTTSNSTTSNSTMNSNSTINGTATPRIVYLQHGRDVSHRVRRATADPTTVEASTGLSSLKLGIEGTDFGYIMTTQIGTPPADFRVLVDSGSADFWVGSEQCVTPNPTGPTATGCGQHQYLGSQSSSTFVDTHTDFNVTYGAGSVSGTVVTDTVRIASLVLPKHMFGVAHIESADWGSHTFDGLVGLAKSNLSREHTPTLVEALHAQGQISTPITSYKISRLADGKDDGEITFGGLDPSKFDPNTIVTMPNSDPRGYWGLPIDAIRVDGQDPGFSEPRSAILDTGTSLLVVSPADAQAIHRLIKGSQSVGNGGYIIPCSSTVSIAVTFDGRAFTIDSRDVAAFPDTEGMCGSGIMGSTVVESLGQNVWLMGDVFLKNVYFSTNVANDTISLAKLV